MLNLSPHQKVFGTLLVLVLVLGIYISLSIKQITVDVNSENLKPKALTSKAKLLDKADQTRKKISEKEYQVEISKVLSDCEEIVFENKDVKAEDTIKKISKTKSEISNLVAPSGDYKELHLNLTLSLVNFEDYIKENNQGFKEKSLWLLNEAKNDYELKKYESS
jgi:predicted Co/Zn/Cd cation transporter (cation efflux family)